MALVLAIGLVLPMAMPVAASTPQTLTVVSDANTLWSADGTNWQAAVPCWVHPSWPTITDASWIWIAAQANPPDEYDNGPAGGYYLQRIVNLPAGATNISGTIWVGTDNAFSLQVNGSPVGGHGNMDRNGPDNQEWNTIESYSIGNLLVPGDNTILIRAINYFKVLDAAPNDSYVSGYDYNDPEKNPAGVVFKAEITYEAATSMTCFMIKKARLDFRDKRDKPDDDKVLVEGKLCLDLVNGNGVDISEPVTVVVGPLSQTIYMNEGKGKKGQKWEYKRPKGETGDIQKMTINWKKNGKGKFDIHWDKADLSSLTPPPVTISILIGDDFGTETIQMKETKHNDWNYKAPKP